LSRPSHRKASVPGWQAAGKTGTSQDWRDAWFIGYTSHLVTGVWLGNDDSSPTKKASGGNLPVEIWSRFMRAALQGVRPQPLPGGIWRDSSPPSVPMAENNGWPLPGLFGAPFGSHAREITTAPSPPPDNLPDQRNDAPRAASPVYDSGAPVPPADIPNAGVPGQKRGAQSGKQNFFDTLFGG
jgi:penicillin-binding protein 1A